MWHLKKNTTWNWIKVKYCKIKLWLPPNAIYIDNMILFLNTLCDVDTIFDKSNWIDKFYNVIFKNVKKTSNH